MKNNLSKFYPVALTIAGSDSGGGAGIQADLRTFNAFAVYGCTAITAITAQNPDGVRRIDPIPAEGVRAQLEAVCSRFAVRIAKTGMLFNRDIVETVSDTVAHYDLPLVVDPVMVATSGAVLLEESAIDAVRNRLLPLADWITPNLPEAELLLGRKLGNQDEYAEAARECARLWKCRVWLKSGHDTTDAENATDFIGMPDGQIFTVTSPRLPDTRAGHGTGCTLSAALTANLAVETPWKQAVCEAKAFVLGGLSEPVEVGRDLPAMYPPEDDFLPLVKMAVRP